MERPLVYFAVSIFISCISTLIFLNKAFLGAVLAASFLILIFFTLNYKEFIVVLLFFILGCFSFINYFNVDINKEITVRILRKDKFYCIADYKGRNLSVLGNLNKVEEGDKVRIKGDFKKKDIYRLGSIGSFKVKKHCREKRDFIYKIYNLKKIAYIKFKQYLGEEKAATVMSLCFGETKYMSNSEKDTLKKLGVVHVISVSGFHMALIYNVIEKIIKFPFSIPVALLYVVFTGMKASSIRAFIMILILKSSKKFFRKYDSLSALSLACIIILLKKPYYILDIGFMLSFLCTLGIILNNKKMSRYLYKLPRKLNESLSLTLSAQIYSFPYICFTLKNFGLGFIIGNLILVPLYAPVVLLGNLALFLIKVPVIFPIINKIIYTILTIIRGGQLILDNLTPSIMGVSYIHGILFSIIYISYLLYNHGYKKIKYLPIYFFFFLMFLNYNIYPKLYYIRGNGYEVSIIKYKFETTMICSYNINSAKDILKIKEEVKPKKIITNPSISKKLNLDNNFQFYINPYLKEECRKYNLILSYKRKIYVFSQDKHSLPNIKNKYTMINLNNKNGLSKEKNASFMIFLGKVYSFNY
ncbi:ComEC/Rec2 family competence protein [Clostridium niameyense]|uniref:ComEC/Rec2 family competence protein n=1 Tax=Clostridium niameyense TaxID=1622073 RepID=UPI00067EC6B0|nr:ComEC/Rec2 family competence protein [Clostridium niameyense]